jgi:DNA-binding MarR family transcriptional regulator
MPASSQPDIAFPGDAVGVRVVPSLVAIAKLSRCLLTLKLGEIRLFCGQDELLLRLTPEVPATVSALAEALDVRPSTVSKMIDRLSAVGLIERSQGSDKRETLVSVTAAGIELRTQVLAIHAGIDAEFAKYLPEGAEATVPPALASTEAALRRIVARLR